MIGSLFTTPSTLILPCPKGVAPFLSEELRSLGYPVISQSVASVETQGSLVDTQRLNLWLRTANRVLYLLEESVAKSVEELYRNLHAIAWEDIIPEDDYLVVRTVS